jgi:predicted O-linked N-acetylglucosamine transferase (SPINDLY family)
MDYLTEFERALAEHNAGRFPAALAAIENAWPQASVAEREALATLRLSIHLKRGDRREAAKAAVEAARLAPGKRAQFLQFAVDLFTAEGQHAEILAIADEAAAAHPGDGDFLFKIATSCKLAGNLLAAAPFIAGLDLAKPAHFTLFGEFEHAFGDPDRFYQFLVEACATRPDNVLLNSRRYAVARQMSDFPALREFDRRLADRNDAIAQGLLHNELALMRLIRTDDERAHLQPSYDALAVPKNGAPKSRRPISPAGGRLRIGYLSNDFCAHVTMTLFEDVLLQHDRERFDIKLFCYTGERAARYQEKWPQHLRDSVITVRGMSDAAAAQYIADHGIDILVDLKGHTSGARPGILDRSDSPIKATYLGFPGSVTGVDIDYALTDAVVTPDSSKPFYAEKLCRLPETYQSNGSRGRPRPLPLGRRDFGLPEDRLILASFNAAHKITGGTLDLWARIMRELPDAALLILCREGRVRDNIRAAFKAAGADPRQIIFFGKQAYEPYLTRIALVDLALDTHPYNGHTTSSDILWAGTPLVTFKGGSFAARVSESLLLAIGLPELVARDETDYCRLAVELARDSDRRQQIRQRLAANRTIAPLFDTDRFTRHLERAYQLMAERARNGLPPDHIDVDALPRRTTAF